MTARTRVGNVPAWMWIILAMGTGASACAQSEDKKVERRVSEAATIWQSDCLDELVFDYANESLFYYDARGTLPHKIRVQVHVNGQALPADDGDVPQVRVWNETLSNVLREGAVVDFTPEFAGQRLVLEAMNGSIVSGASYRFAIERCSQSQPSTSDFELRVMTANTAHYSSSIPKTGMLEAFAASASDVDVIVMNEPNPDIDVPGLLGLYAYDVPGNGNTGFQILTRWEATGTLHNGLTLNPCPGVEFHVVGVHLRPYPYEPYVLRDNPDIAIQTLVDSANSTRGGEVNRMMAWTLRPLLERGAAVIVGGDFNEPSHLDWTPDAQAAGLHAQTVEWPASLRFFNEGLSDTYRTVLPDEVAWPGFTWTPLPESDHEVHDRIDFLYHSRALDAVDVQVVGESLQTSDIEVWPFPSDHRWVIGTYVVHGARCQ